MISRNQKTNIRMALTFEKVLNIYQCDKRFKNVLMYSIDEIEHNLKVKTAYILAHAIGELGYMDSVNFKNSIEHQKFQAIFLDTIQMNQNLPFVQHHQSQYNGKFPIWVAVELFSLGTLTKFYKNLDTPYQKLIAKEFNISVAMLYDWMYNIKQLRNICAHYLRLYNYIFPRVPLKDKYDSNFPQYTHKVFDLAYIMKNIILYENDWNNHTLPSISHLFDEYKEYIDINAYGFSDNWRNLLRK